MVFKLPFTASAADSLCLYIEYWTEIFYYLLAKQK